VTCGEAGEPTLERPDLGAGTDRRQPLAQVGPTTRDPELEQLAPLGHLRQL